MKIVRLLISAICIASFVAIITAEEEYTDDAIEPVKQSPLPVRGSPLLRRGPSPRAIGKAAPTTTTTTPKPEAPVGDEEYDYEEGENPEGEKQEPETPVSTTTAKPRLGAHSVRPFRSNDDLLAALLKRRREQASGAKAHPKTVAESITDNEDSPQPPKKALSNNKARTKVPSRFSSSRASAQQEEDAPAAAPVEASTARASRARFNSRTPTRFDKRQVDVEGAGSETSQQVAPRSFRPKSRS